MQTNQTPGALAEDIKSRVTTLAASKGEAGILDRIRTMSDLHDAIDILRDMAASAAKDAERYQAIRSANEGSGSEDLCLCVVKNVHFDFVSTGAELDKLADAAIAATKRGEG